MARPFKLFNAQLREKVRFQSKVPDVIRLYVCGMTVYDLCHLGHARVMVVFDMVVRAMRAFGYRVEYVQNITDIDDKIIKKASNQGLACSEIVDTYLVAMQEDAAALGVVPPDHTPQATAYIHEMIKMIEILIQKKHAYVAQDGDVYFDVRSFKAYGRLTHQNLETLYEAVRKHLSEHKKDALDFILWKRAKLGEPSWESPWGLGRPGWHIECSAMALTLLGSEIDVHGGGVDLKFPHHENEIAQAECATGQAFVRHWMHVGHVLVDDEKMSKSLGNFTTIRDVLSCHHAEVIRYMLLSTHYRHPVNYTLASILGAKRALISLYHALESVPTGMFDAGECEEFYIAMSDDFNTPKALSVCFEYAKAVVRFQEIDPSRAGVLAANLQHCLKCLGLGEASAVALSQQSVQIPAADIEAQICARNQAREEKNWDLADKIRAELLEQGIVLEDNQDQTSWRVE